MELQQKFRLKLAQFKQLALKYNNLDMYRWVKTFEKAKEINEIEYLGLELTIKKFDEFM